MLSITTWKILLCPMFTLCLSNVFTWRTGCYRIEIACYIVDKKESWIIEIMLIKLIWMPQYIVQNLLFYLITPPQTHQHPAFIET